MLEQLADNESTELADLRERCRQPLDGYNLVDVDPDDVAIEIVDEGKDYAIAKHLLGEKLIADVRFVRNRTSVVHLKDNVIHNPNGPATILKVGNQTALRRFLSEGKLHNLHGPALERWGHLSSLGLEKLLQGNMVDDEVTEALVALLRGQMVERGFYRRGRPHNDYGPAYESWWLNCLPRSLRFCSDGLLHNPIGPADLGWHDNGQLSTRRHAWRGLLHNENGPADEEWDELGGLLLEDCYLRGEACQMSDLESSKHLQEWLRSQQDSGRINLSKFQPISWQVALQNVMA